MELRSGSSCGVSVIVMVLLGGCGGAGEGPLAKASSLEAAASVSTTQDFSRAASGGDDEYCHRDRNLCAKVDMLWRAPDGTVLRRDPNCASGEPSPTTFCYSFVADSCAGYRCLVHEDISPACYTLKECHAACRAHCVSIPGMRQRCSAIDDE